MPEKVRAIPFAVRPVAAEPPLPRLPGAHVARPRLSQRLLTSDARLTLICTPAGFGKSVLFNECARRALPGVRLVWLDLLGHALTPAELLARLAAALQMPHGEGDPFQELSLLLSRVEQPLWVFLDDYPRQPSAELDACLDRLLERAPHTLRWWINGRRRPAWNLPRLLLQGDLLELDAHDLALDDDELTRLLRQRQLDLPSELQTQLMHHSEGWLAGICLLLMQGTPHNLAERLASGTALLQEYIEREVLVGLPDDLHRALMILAHMPRFSAELCLHLADGQLAACPLGDLRERQLFLHSMDSCGEWFRLWCPLATMLRRRAQGHPPLQAHLRACQWFAARGDVREAVEHALRAEQPEVAANFLQQYGQEQLLIGHSVAQFLHWRTELPASLFSSTPRLITLQAWALIICARLDEVEGCLADLARFLPQPSARRQQQLLAQYQAIQGVLLRQRGQRRARQHCLEALDVLAPTAWSQRVLCYQALAQQAMAENDLDAAQHYGDTGLKLAREMGSVLFEALLTVDRVHLLDMRGESARAMEEVEQALQHLASAGRRGPVLARLMLLRGHLLAGRGDADEALDALRAGLEEAQGCEDAYVLFGYQGLAELAAERGDLDQAQALLRDAERQMQWQHVPEVRYRGVLQWAAASLALRQGDGVLARQTLLLVQQRFQVHDLLAPSGFYDLQLRTRHALLLTDLRAGDTVRAEAGLTTLHDECLRAGHAILACECAFSLAQAAWLAGAVGEADGRLAAALREAVRLDHLRPARELDDEWLARCLAGLDQPELLRRLGPSVVAVAEVANDSLLSKRELTVLELIAQGLSNQQIARELYISLHTVKTHARRINVKLGVERRTQAVARAKALGWMQ